MVQQLAALDHKILFKLRSNRVTARHASQIETFSRLGEYGVIWLFLGFLGMLAQPRKREKWLHGVQAVSLAYLVNTLLKMAIRRSRPKEPPPLTKTPTQLSFPSAHAATSFAAASAYGRVLPAPPLFVFASLMVLSRLMLGVHYPSDILAGAALGTTIEKIGTKE